MDELRTETQHFLNGESVSSKEFVHPIPFNLIPHIDSFQENGYTREEMKVTWETRKYLMSRIFPFRALPCVFQHFRAHTESVTIETEKTFPRNCSRDFRNITWVDVVDDLKNLQYPMPLNASEKYNVEVGRIRQNLIFERKESICSSAEINS